MLIEETLPYRANGMFFSVNHVILQFFNIQIGINSEFQNKFKMVKVLNEA